MTDLGCFSPLLPPPTGCYGGAKLSLFCRENSIFVGDVNPLWALALCINCIDRLFCVCLYEFLLQPGLVLPGLHVCQSACTTDPPAPQPSVLLPCVICPQAWGSVYQELLHSHPDPASLAWGMPEENLTWAPPSRSPCASPTTSWKRRGPLEGASLRSLLSFTPFWSSHRGRGWGFWPQHPLDLTWEQVTPGPCQLTRTW